MDSTHFGTAFDSAGDETTGIMYSDYFEEYRYKFLSDYIENDTEKKYNIQYILEFLFMFLTLYKYLNDNAETKITYSYFDVNVNGAHNIIKTQQINEISDTMLKWLFELFDINRFENARKAYVMLNQITILIHSFAIYVKNTNESEGYLFNNNINSFEITQSKGCVITYLENAETPVKMINHIKSKKKYLKLHDFNKKVVKYIFEKMGLIYDNYYKDEEVEEDEEYEEDEGYEEYEEDEEDEEVEEDEEEDKINKEKRGGNLRKLNIYLKLKTKFNN